MRRRPVKLPTDPRASQANAPSERQHMYPARPRVFAGSVRAYWRAHSTHDKSTLHAYTLLQFVPACLRPAPRTFHVDTSAADNRARSCSTPRALARVHAELKAGARLTSAKDGWR